MVNIGQQGSDEPLRPHGLKQLKSVFGDIERYIVTLADGTRTLNPDFEAEFLSYITLPFPLAIAGRPGKVARRLNCHRLLVGNFQAVFRELAEEKYRPHLKTFGGAFNFRPKSSGRGLSTHSWGIAIDLNPETNRRGTKGEMPADIVSLFKAHGFVWGGIWNGVRKDPMHFQYCTGY
jgi:hypothetical protein